VRSNAEFNQGSIAHPDPTIAEYIMNVFMGVSHVGDERRGRPASVEQSPKRAHVRSLFLSAAFGGSANTPHLVRSGIDSPLKHESLKLSVAFWMTARKSTS
jgi:hypothetical protein